MERKADESSGSTVGIKLHKFKESEDKRRISKVRLELKEEIEVVVMQTSPELEKDFAHRIIAFSLSGTEIVDLKHFDNKKAKIACGLRTDILTTFLCQMVDQKRKFKQMTVIHSAKDFSMSADKSAINSPRLEKENSILSHHFQETIQI